MIKTELKILHLYFHTESFLILLISNFLKRSLLQWKNSWSNSRYFNTGCEVLSSGPFFCNEKSDLRILFSPIFLSFEQVIKKKKFSAQFWAFKKIIKVTKYLWKKIGENRIRSMIQVMSKVEVEDFFYSNLWPSHKIWSLPIMKNLPRISYQDNIFDYDISKPDVENQKYFNCLKARAAYNSILKDTG